MQERRGGIPQAILLGLVFGGVGAGFDLSHSRPNPKRLQEMR